jgi:hypothetical protein
MAQHVLSDARQANPGRLVLLVRRLHDGLEQDDRMAVARDHDLLTFESASISSESLFLASATLWLLIL